MKIRFGVCADVSSVPDIAKAGYDYFEYNFGSLAKMSDDAYLNFAKTVSGLPILPECFNCFFRPTSLLSEKRLTSELSAHMQKRDLREQQKSAEKSLLSEAGEREEFLTDMTPRLHTNSFAMPLTYAGMPLRKTA